MRGVIIRGSSISCPAMSLPAQVVALSRLFPGTMQSLAASVGLPRSNFQSALAGRRPMPDAAQALLRQAIGLDAAGQLEQGRVYRWKVRDVGDLLAVVRHWLAPADVLALRPKNGKPPLEPLWLLATSKRDLFAVVDGMDAPSWAALHPDLLHSGALLAIEDWPAWNEARIPAEAIRAMLNTVTQPSSQPDWMDVIREAEKLGLAPKDVLAWVAGNPVK